MSNKTGVLLGSERSKRDFVIVLHSMHSTWRKKTVESAGLPQNDVRVTVDF